MAQPSPPGLFFGSATSVYPCPCFRLVDEQGQPHPVLDDHYESREAAWADATVWWRRQHHPEQEPVGIGIEVSTSSGSWRTIRPPCA